MMLAFLLTSCEVTKVRQMLVSDSVDESKQKNCFIEEYDYEYQPICYSDTIKIVSIFSEHVHFYKTHNTKNEYSIYNDESQLIIKMADECSNIICVNAYKRYGDKYLICTNDTNDFHSKKVLFVKLKSDRDTMLWYKRQRDFEEKKILDDEIPIGVITIKKK